MICNTFLKMELTRYIRIRFGRSKSAKNRSLTGEATLRTDGLIGIFGGAGASNAETISRKASGTALVGPFDAKIDHIRKDAFGIAVREDA